MYDSKEFQYFSNIREDLIRLLPPNRVFPKVLEIGCGNGATLDALKKRGLAKIVYGVDIVDLKDKKMDIDFFIADNVEKMDLKFEKESFDLIILGDVLEHLLQPWESLAYIKSFLSKDGLIIASLPNIRYVSIMKSVLINGDFKYESSGILDRTHLRFFCKKNICEMFSSAGLELIKILSHFQLLGRGKKAFLYYWFDKITFGVFRDFLTFQYLILARKEDDATIC